MSHPTKPVPDPATTYERAKPKEQSPSGQLDGPHVNPPKKPDQLQKDNKEPDQPKHERPQK